MKQYKIKKNSLQETLIIPLYARWLCSQKFPGLFQDETAGELIKKVDYDFSALEKQSESIMHSFGALEVAMRQNDLAWEIRDYLHQHPKAAVVVDWTTLDECATTVSAISGILTCRM